MSYLGSVEQQARGPVVADGLKPQRQRLWQVLGAGGVAIVCVVVWWAIRSAEQSHAEEAFQQRVDSELATVRQQLERSDRTLQRLESLVIDEGLSSDAVQDLVQQDREPFSELYVVDPSAPPSDKLPFGDPAADSEAVRLDNVLQSLAENPDQGLTPVSYSPQSDGTALLLAKRVEASGGSPIPSVIVGAIPLQDNFGASPEKTVSGDDHISLRFSVDGQLVSEVDHTVAQHELWGDPTEFEIGGTMWSVQPIRTNNIAQHVGSNFFWAAGVALSTMMFFLLRRSKGPDTDEDNILGETYRLVDPATGLLNAEGTKKELTTRLSRRKRTGQVGVLLCGLDRYNFIKQTLGPVVAEGVVGLMTQRLHELLQGSDSCGRVGESDLLVMSNGLPTLRDLELLAKEVGEQFEAPIELSDGTICNISFSIGIASSRSDEATARELLANAALAQKQAKDSGGGCYVLFDDDLRKEAVIAAELQQEFLQTVGEGGLDVHYQAVIERDPDGSLPSKVNKFEAFVRWPHPLRGMVHPQVFLPIASATGLGLKVTEFVLRDACAQAKTWSKIANRPISVTVNIGERQLLDLRLVKLIDQVLNEVELPAEQLELDITEELILRKSRSTQTVLKKLALSGVSVSLDDFGASQASLQQLREVSLLSTLKIDRAFVAEVANSEVNQKVISAVVAMANESSVEVIAEGVETEEQVEVLQRLNVYHYQGFLFHRPSVAADVAKFLVRQDSSTQQRTLASAENV